MKKDQHIPADKWALILSGHEDDLYRGFEHCYNDLYRLGIYLYKDPELVKECIQLLFVELWRGKDRKNTVTNAREYTLMIFKRILYKQRTGSKKHWSALTKIDGCDEIPTIDSYEEMLIVHQASEERRQRLLSVLPQLAGRQRELIWLRYFENRNIDEITKLTSLTARTVYNTLHNALQKLRVLMD